MAVERRRWLRVVARVAAWLLFAWGVAQPALASGPRYVTGPPFFTASAGRAVVWRQSNLLYSTDPGDLSASIDHAAADRLVASAASVWNVPVASITLGQGGTLAEHVSGSNTYLSGSGMVYPADVDRANAGAVPIAVVYDTDGSVTETLLGAGASDPLSCRQNAVTESVDAFDPAGYLLHAVLVVNGRCAGPAAAQQLELRYHLERAFGRVLGLAWSQTNDNAFTGSPVPTYDQYLHWPVMHPIDVVCGPYSYQCMPNPFTLRDDDVAGLAGLYPVAQGAAATGKQPSLAGASAVAGAVQFPTGAGMAGVNVRVQRRYLNSTQVEPWYETSSVSGFGFRRAGQSPFVAAGTDALASQGTDNGGFAGYFSMAYVPQLPRYAQDTLVASIEPVNPLYTGAFSVGPYSQGTVAPSGSLEAPVLAFGVGAYGTSFLSLPLTGAAASCGPGGDGTFALPAAPAASGWWTGLLCGYGHAAYTALAVRPGRTLTLEATALDDQGFATYQKAMPVLGVFSANDQPGSLPSVAVAPLAFTGRGIGTTSLTAATGRESGLVIGIADQRGDGRPDFRYQARILYADTLTPAQVPDSGGVVTISGLGFRAGNTVAVNGIAGTVISTGSNALVVRLPSRSAAGAAAGQALDVTVADLGTGGSSVMAGVVRYGAPVGSARLMKLLTVQAGTAFYGSPAPVPFAVQMLAADGVTPVANEPVAFSLGGGSARFDACGLPACTVLSDASGVAATTVTPLAAGTISMQAADGVLAETGSFTALEPAASIKVLLGPAASGLVDDAYQPLIVQVLDRNGNGMAARQVNFTATAGSVFFDRCAASTCALVTDNSGVSVVQFMPTQTGAVTVRAASSTAAVDVSMTATDNSDVLTVVHAPDARQLLGQAEAYTVRLFRHDGTTYDVGRTVVFTASDGVIFPGCGSNPCTAVTDGDGLADTVVRATRAGTFSITASYGQLSQTLSFTVAAPANSIRIVSAPSGTVLLNRQTATPFTIQVLGPDGVTPVPGLRIALAGPPDAVVLDLCNTGGCALNTDSNGMVSVNVTPIQAGLITLDAVAAPLVVSTSFQAAGATRTMQVVTAPGAAGVQMGDQASFAVKVLESDGVTPLVGGSVNFSTTYGSFLVGACGYATCSIPTDQDGKASITGFGLAPGLAAVTATATFAPLSETMSFPVYAPGPVMRLASAPAGSVMVGHAASLPMAVQMLDRDGITPLAGRQVTFAVTQGLARLGVCAASTCSVTTDGNGLAQTSVTPTGLGPIALLASDGAANQSATLTGVAPSDVLAVVSVPGSDSVVGKVATLPFAVQAMQADQVTPAAGRTVTVSVTSGHASLAACAGAAACTLPTDASGRVSTAVTPQTTGAITLAVNDAGVVASASFVAGPAPDQMTVVAAPPAHVLVGAAAGLAVAVLAGDGFTPRVGRAVVFSVTAGQALLAACGQSTCTLATGSDGSAATSVTPLAPGAIAVAATAGSLGQVVSFTADARPDTLAVLSQPADGAFVGERAATVFAVKATAGDGTAAAGRSIALSAGNATLTACGASTCVVAADGTGVAASGVVPSAAGPVTLAAADGNVSLATSFLAVLRPDSLTLLSAPADGAFAGERAPAAFAVKITAGDGSAAAGRRITLSAGNATLDACGATSCLMVADGSGVAASGVIPSAAGTVTLGAVDGSATLGTSFQAVRRPDILTVTAQPADGSLAGQVAAAPFSVRVLQGDRVTAASGVRLNVAVTGGAAVLGACGQPACVLLTDAAGLASTQVTPAAAGVVTITLTEAADPRATATISFRADPRPDRLLAAAALPATMSVGDTAGFAIQALLADGVTPAAGRQMSVRVGAGAGSFPLCGAAACLTTTDQVGRLALQLTALAAGPLTISVAEAAAPGSNTLELATTVLPQPDILRLVASPASVQVGQTAATPLTVRLTLADGATPVAGAPVRFNALGLGVVSLGGCSGLPCTQTTDTNGVVSLAVSGVSGGAVRVSAEAQTAVPTQPVAAAIAVAGVANSLTALTGTTYVAEGAVFARALGVLASAVGAGVPGLPVEWSATGAASVLTPTSSTGADGSAEGVASFGPLAAGSTAGVAACAWSGICVSFAAVGVSADDWQASIESGDAQVVVASPLAPVTLRLTDAAGHALAGAPVAIHQTVTAGDQSCPAQGRCPAARVLATLATVSTSDADGLVSVAPLSVDDQPSTTHLLFSTGTNASAGVVLRRQP